MEKNCKQKDVKNFYQGAKSRNGGRKQGLLFVKDKDGNLLDEEEEIIDKWREYFTELLKGSERETLLKV